MIDTLLEGVESLRLPCSWVLLIPAAAITIFGRRRTPLVTSVFVAVATLIAWVRFAGWWFETPRGFVQIALGLIVMAAAAIAWKLDRGISDAATSAITAVVAVWAWIPCVGPELADILNGARREPLAHLGGTVAFFLGLLLPFISIAAAGVAFPKLQEKLAHRAIISTGAIVLGLVGLLFVTTLYDDLASALFRISEF